MGLRGWYLVNRVFFEDTRESKFAEGGSSAFRLSFPSFRFPHLELCFGMGN